MVDITINPSEFKLVDGDFLSKDTFSDHIFEEGGSFQDDCQLMIFKCGQLKVDVYYEIRVSGHIFEDAGDYWNPPSSDVDIKEVDVTITDVLIDEDELELTPELRSVFLKLVNNNL